jgi:hypothetical protein
MREAPAGKENSRTLTHRARLRLSEIYSSWLYRILSFVSSIILDEVESFNIKIFWNLARREMPAGQSAVAWRVSRISVTGPSLTSSTSMCSWKRPVSTSIPCPRTSATNPR